MIPRPLVAVTRGDHVESVHHGYLVVVDRAGRVVEDEGAEVRIFPRSALKAMQAMPLVRLGAARRLGLSPRMLALASASHSGLPEQRELVGEMLAIAGQEATCLACGASDPLDPELALAMKARGEAPTPLHHNCSGKHAGMLLLCRDQGWRPEGYWELAHPVQQAIRTVLAEVATPELEHGVDGCSVVAWRLPLVGLARAFATLGREAEWAPLRDAARAHPELVAGPGRWDTVLMQAAPALVVKSGAEGVHAGVDLESGMAWALKVADGTRRAVAPAVMALLRRHALLPPEARQVLAAWEVAPLTNAAGRRVGEVRPIGS